MQTSPSEPIRCVVHIADDFLSDNYDAELETRLKDSAGTKSAMFQMLIDGLFNRFVINLPDFYNQSWQMNELSNGGFYLLPDDGIHRTVQLGNFSVSMDADQLGVSLSFMLFSALAEKTKDKVFRQLCHDLELYMVQLDRENQADGIKTFLKLSRLI